jgi:hypothetical protein
LIKIIEATMFFRKKKTTNANVFKFPSIDADGYFEFSDLAEITSDIGDNAKIKITGSGGLLVRGNVGNNVEIIIEDGTGLSSIINIVIRNGSAKRYDDQAFSGNVIIEGHCGDHVNIATHGDIHLGTAGNNLTANAGHEFTAQRLGDYPSIETGFDVKIDGDSGARTIINAGHNINAANMGENSEIQAGFDIQCGDIGDYSECEAGHGIKIKSTGEHCVLESGFDIKVKNLGASSRAESGHNFKADLIGEDCRVEAGFDIKAKQAFNSAVLDSSFPTTIDNYIDSAQKAEAEAEAESKIETKTTTKNKTGHTPRNFDIM